MRLRHPDRNVVTSSTDVVIEGFPGSANTYVREALLLVEPSLRIASHTHSPANALEGARRGVPTLVLVRDPVAATLSFVDRHGGHTPAWALRRYVTFHEALLGRLDGIHVATFEDATTRLGVVIDAMNEALASSLPAFDDEDLDLRRRLDDKIRADSGRLFGAAGDAQVALPSAARAAERAAAEADLRRADPTLVAAAERAHADLLAEASRLARPPSTS
jgi:hypothetical protein